MNILIMRLCFISIVIIAILWMKRPSFWAISGGLAAALVLYGICIPDTLSIMGRSMASKDTVTVILSFYFITFLRRMLEHRGRLKQAEQSLNWLFNNRRVNASVILAVVGSLPSADTAIMYAGIVRPSCRGYLNNENITCVTSLYRHIPESFLPTYSFILIVLAVSGVGAREFILTMLSLVATLFLIGHMLYLGKVPGSTGQKTEEGGKRAAVMLFRSLWPIILIVVLITALDIPAYVAAPMTAVLNVFVDHLKPWETKPIFRTAFKPIIIFSTILTMMFKDITTYTRVIHELPVFFRGLPIPLPVVFALIFFFGTIASGFNAIMPLCIPMAMAAMSGADAPPLALLMNSAYAAIQVFPTHICLFIAAECFKVDIDALVRRNIPMILVLFAVTLVYIALLDVF